MNTDKDTKKPLISINSLNDNIDIKVNHENIAGFLGRADEERRC